jgi:hypothetical protein
MWRKLRGNWAFLRLSFPSKLRRKRIEPADGATYSLRQIVDSQLPGDSAAEKSLQAHAVECRS